MKPESQRNTRKNPKHTVHARAASRLRGVVTCIAAIGLAAGVFATARPLAAAESGADAQRGAKAFQTCIACHSLEPARHMSGPALDGILGRKAGTAKGFMRYSDALLKSDVVWTERNLDEWLANPGKMIPGNEMAFPGIGDAQARRDLIAYLKAVSEGGEAPRGPRMPSLKLAQAGDVVKAIRYCGDTYFVTTEAGKALKIWEFNLRLKTDSTEFGPHSGRPVLVGVGMRGDRAAIVFSAAGEIASMVKSGC
jgi:cytochrome c